MIYRGDYNLSSWLKISKSTSFDTSTKLNMSSWFDTSTRLNTSTWFDTSTRLNTSAPEDSSQFPDDLFTVDQLRHGAVVLHILGTFYAFAIIGIICDVYFLPSIDCICCNFHLSQNIAAATFMSLATAVPDFFINIIGTFVTETDLGIGAILGGVLFGFLGVATCGGLTASRTIHLDWWPLIRDCSTNIIVISCLIAVVWDQSVVLWEAISLMLLYPGYLLIIVFNTPIERFIKWIVKNTCNRPQHSERATLVHHEEHISNISSGIEYGTMFNINETRDLEEDIYEANWGSLDYVPYFINHNWQSVEPLGDGNRDDSTEMETSFNNDDSLWNERILNNTNEHRSISLTSSELADIREGSGIFTMPKVDTIQLVWWFLTWPPRFLMYVTIPDCSKKYWRRFYPVTLIMCIIWLAGATYFSAWMITVAGTTFGLSDSFMGLTFLALGSAMPEAISCIILARQGVGGMGFSNALGCNILDICLCTAFPWFLKILISKKQITMQSPGMEISCIILLISAISLLIIAGLNGFKLNKRMGLYCACTYVVLVILLLLVEFGAIKRSAKVSYINR